MDVGSRTVATHYWKVSLTISTALWPLQANSTF